MKLIKKIAAIMFAFMMVVSMSCNVKADDTTATTETGEGKITINNAIPKQTYKLYRLLDLESYSVNEDGQKENGNYSYKPTSKWKTFLEGNGIRDVYFTFENGYASWKKDANVETFAKLAIEHANKENTVIEAEKTEVAPTAAEGKNTSTVTFENLPLGYYLVDSSVGTLCSLDTTNTDATIREKMVYHLWIKKLAVQKLEIMIHQTLLALVIQYILKQQLLHNQELKTMYYMTKWMQD